LKTPRLRPGRGRGSPCTGDFAGSDLRNASL